MLQMNTRGSPTTPQETNLPSVPQAGLDCPGQVSLQSLKKSISLRLDWDVVSRRQVQIGPTYHSFPNANGPCTLGPCTLCCWHPCKNRLNGLSLPFAKLQQPERWAVCRQWVIASQETSQTLARGEHRNASRAENSITTEICLESPCTS